MAYIGKAPSSTGITNVTSNPIATTNPLGGVGSLVSNTLTGEMYICTDATTNVNVWKAIGNVQAKDEATAAAIALS